MKWSLRSEPTGQSLTDLHSTDFAQVADLYHNQNPQSSATYRRREQTLQPKFTMPHREQLVEALRPFLASIDAPAAARKEVERLLDPEATVVVAGQQAGLFTGPLYSLYKALSAVGLARRLEAELGKPVVPVFWIASEDHDWGEVDHAYLLDASDNVKRIRLPEPAPLHQMVHHYPVSRPSAQAVLEELARTLPQGPWRSEVLEAVEECARKSTTLVGWFASLMYRLLGDTNLVMLDPCLPGLRQLVAHVWSDVVTKRDELATRLDAKYTEVLRRGFEPAVIRDDENTTLFYVADGKRYVLERTSIPNRLRVRGLGVEDSVQGWLHKIEESPTSFSSNVLLRPVVQDCLLPTLAFVGGPAEIAYHALSAAVFETLGRELPPLLLRDRLTLYPPTVLRSMEKWEISMADVGRPADLESRAVHALGGTEFDIEYERMLLQTKERWQRWGEEHASLGPQIQMMAEAEAKREAAGIHKTTQKAKNFLARIHETELRQLRHVERWLWVDGHQQERRLCPLNFWTRYGLDWLLELPFWGDYSLPRGIFDVLM
ncbi:bacillithiol biosynthesis cysteine-adding enzyme BshC [Alicyclobacillus curvatus]|jgi:bacillithiol synthase|nr:bacillithiol biosynthesis cysteine-adding enzyme BshC [Alicyclobacillus curvatus]